MFNYYTITNYLSGIKAEACMPCFQLGVLDVLQRYSATVRIWGVYFSKWKNEL